MLGEDLALAVIARYMVPQSQPTAIDEESPESTMSSSLSSKGDRGAHLTERKLEDSSCSEASSTCSDSETKSWTKKDEEAKATEEDWTLV